MTPEQYRQFQRGLDAIREAERGPTGDALASTPTLDLWRVLIDRRPYPMLVLWGEVSGHPKLGTDMITTSRLIALNRNAGWARSVSRWYKLGRPFAAFEADLASRMGQANAKPGSLVFHLPGFAAIDDAVALEQILADHIALMRRIGANHGID
ncbi:hypothetical protein SAMN04489859_10584 [Paracoccus alcaliphilus]|uniref:ATP-dependent Lon protease n=1 Tax=Paracoccus alcaliphilus TaxID=34002 RepID=A0A1H8NDS5_9RHOB|nr:DUF6634 family protein [Paracoccus alcaliphilus]WCR18761.1 ATP-dependent Lon protease [Paracoccus alcaliphilus]SEO27881.1 hypothetical protein SAMN04489859_10584 [Paracoccus alcaliphilus]